MTFAQRRNRLTTHFSERIPFVKRRMTIWSRVIPEKMIGLQQGKKFRRRGITQKKAYNIQNTAKVWNHEEILSLFYGTRQGGGVITAFTRARRLSLSCATAVCANYPTSWRNNFIFISHTTRFPEWFFPLSFFTRILYAAFLSLLYPIRATCPAHLILLDLITRIIFDEMYSS